MEKSVYSIDKISELTRSVFDKYDFVEKAYLFGSYAKNDAKENSDLDIIVTLNQPMSSKFFELYPVLEDATNKKIDIYSDSELDPRFLNAIRKDFVQIYERKNENSV